MTTIRMSSNYDRHPDIRPFDIINCKVPAMYHLQYPNCTTQHLVQHINGVGSTPAIYQLVFNLV